MNGSIPALIGLCACLLAAGCGNTPRLPNGAKAVGGGIQIEYHAPLSGTAILVDEANGKIVATKSLTQGSLFEFDAALATDEAVLKALYGDKIPANARFILYFVPNPVEK